MRATVHPLLEAGRERSGYYGGCSSDGHYGRFFVRGPRERVLCIISSAADDDDRVSEGWEHVSVTVAGTTLTPRWEEMCFVKDLFWNEDECVVQYHPARTDYINEHPGCLHMFRHKARAFPMPPQILIGKKQPA